MDHAAVRVSHWESVAADPTLGGELGGDGGGPGPRAKTGRNVTPECRREAIDSYPGGYRARLISQSPFWLG